MVQELTVSKLTLVDSNGVTRAILSCTAGEGGTEGSTTLELWTKHGPALDLFCSDSGDMHVTLRENISGANVATLGITTFGSSATLTSYIGLNDHLGNAVFSQKG